MTYDIEASRIIQAPSTPAEEGQRLAENLIQGVADWDDAITIDLRGLPARLLISSFFNGFLQTLHERAPDHLEQARRIKWRVMFTFQDQNIKNWMENFRPFEKGPIITRVGWDWKRGPSFEDLRGALEPFGVQVYRDPSYEGTDGYGYLFSERHLTKEEILEAVREEGDD